MRKPKPGKAAVVAEVRDRLAACDAAIFTEYRGLTVADLSELRRAMSVVGGRYTVYKNRLVSLAAVELELEVGDLLTGPTAIAFVSPDGDAAAVAKVLRDFAGGDRPLVLKGGVLNRAVIGIDDLEALADLPSREVILSQLAGALAAPMAKTAGLLQALPRKFACALDALIAKRGDSGEASPGGAEGTEHDDGAGSAAGIAGAVEAGTPA